MDTEKWGRSKARERYGSTGMKPMADGGSTEPRFVRAVNDAMVGSAEGLARGLNKVSRTLGGPFNKGAVSVQQNADMNRAEEISNAVPRRKE